MVSIAGNRYLYNSFQQNKGKPVEFGVAKPAFKGDIIEIILMMNVGDSVVCLIDADQVYKNTKQKKPDFIKKGDKVQYMIKLVSIKTKEVLQKEQQANINKQLKEQMAKQQAEEKKLTAIQDKELQKYFIKNNLTPLKTPSGLYYIIKEEGQGAKPITNDTVSLNYRGQLIDGTIFDSNIDSAFNHMTPFEFPLGVNRVIKGWDEGVALLPLGTKATFYIPSRLGYSAQAMPGNPNNPKGIPANSILIFDVELLKIKSLNK
jgi:FKBP-type peptidyl-prolyl cis-trans isomerase FkpA